MEIARPLSTQAEFDRYAETDIGKTPYPPFRFGILPNRNRISAQKHRDYTDSDLREKGRIVGEMGRTVDIYELPHRIERIH